MINLSIQNLCNFGLMNSLIIKMKDEFKEDFCQIKEKVIDV